MLSVIIPTMWKFEPFLDMLRYMLQLPCIGEIIVINNNKDATPHDKLSTLYEHSHKLRVYDFDKNIYVNPSWNFGAAVARNDKICIMNDDLIVDLKVFLKADEYIQEKRLLVIGYDRDHMGNLIDPNKINTGNMYVNKLSEERNEAYHWGSCFFMHKNDWIEIPAGLDFYYGDNWIGDLMEARGGEIWVITDTFAYTPTSTTCKEFHTDMLLGREGFIFQQLIKNYRERNKL